MSVRTLYNLESSATLFAATKAVIPGGVGSNDRALVDPHPIFISHGKGSRIWDVDGNEYIDYLLAYGPLVLGHAHDELVTAVAHQIERGSVYGASHPLELEVAERLVGLIPSLELVRFGQSGTEAVLTAMRLARAATGRQLIVKFEGQYHGWSDQVAISYAPSEAQAGPLSAPTTVPVSEGQPPHTYEDTVILSWNDLEMAEALFDQRGAEIAGVLTEPIMCNFGLIEPTPGYLEGLRGLCDDHGSILIFDEVQTGFRVHLQGAQGLLGVTPDITCLGKALSGGFPISAVGGRGDLMERIADRRVFHAGTYNTNPLCLAAVATNLSILSRPGTFEGMARLSHRLREGLVPLLEPLGGYVQGSSTVFGIGFGPGPLSCMRDGWANDWSRIMQLKAELRLRGVYTKPTPRDIWYMSIAHTDADVDETLEIAADAVSAISA
jgi:glutamate-1-semialdehyde 2,1-aminomutase